MTRRVAIALAVASMASEAAFRQHGPRSPQYRAALVNEFRAWRRLPRHVRNAIRNPLHEEGQR